MKHKLLITRKHKFDTETMGNLYLNGKPFGYTLEDTDRGLDNSMSLSAIQAKKIYGHTAIPAGTYKVMVTYSPRFKKRLPEIISVPGFSGIRLHGGNTHLNTLGCPLVARNQYIDKPSAWQKIRNWIQGSLEKELTAILDNGSIHEITII